MNMDFLERDADAEPMVADADIRQFVTFVAGDEVFAVDMAPVQEIIRVPEVVQVPLAPATLEGLANLRGKVLPIISLRRIFGFDERAYDDATRAVVIDHGQPLGFVVDRVSSVVAVDGRQIQPVDCMSATVDSKLLSGLLKDVGGHRVVMVLDFARIIASEFAEVPALARAGAAGPLATADAQAGDRDNADEEAASDELQLVSFEVAAQEYAIAIEDVQEIVQMPATIVHVPQAQAHVLGVMTLRKRLLPLVSLRRLFSLPDRAADEQSRIVVISVDEASVGVVVDSVNEVLRVARNDVDAMPAMLARDGNLSDIEQICRLSGGKRLVSIISAQNMFRQKTVRDALSSMEAMDMNMKQYSTESEKGNDDEEQVVVFRLGKEEFGVPIASVQEIVRVPDELTHVPKSPGIVEGVINLRGLVLPVIDLRRRLGMAQVERSDRQRIMVFLIDQVRTGFIVDFVAEVLKVHKSAIEPAPQLSGEQTRLLARMANLEKQKRMVQLIDPLHLIDHSDPAAPSVVQH